MTAFIFISLGILLVIIIVGLSSSNNTPESIIERDKKYSNFFKMGKYIAGHPNLDDPLLKIYMNRAGSNLEIYTGEEWNHNYFFRANIPVDAIKNVTIDDESSIRHKVTMGRFLVLGIFAFAAKKKVTDELGYVTIDWNDGRFDHSTVFEFEGKGAVQAANTARNTLIKKVNEVDSIASIDLGSDLSDLGDEPTYASFKRKLRN